MKLHPYQQKSLIRGGIIVLVILLPVAGFFGGVAYQKGRAPAPSTASSTATSNANGMRRFNRQGLNVGTVTAISASSITITLRSDNSSKTFSISGNTMIRNGQNSASVSDIKVGDNVVVQENSTNVSQADRILLGGGGFFGGNNTAPTSTQ